MIVEPEQRVEDFAKAGADIISVHCEAETKGNGMERFFGVGGETTADLGWFFVGDFEVHFWTNAADARLVLISLM